MQLKTFFSFFLIFFILFASLSPVIAKEDENECVIEPSAVLTMDDPVYAVPLLKDANYKLTGLQSVNSFAPVAEQKDQFIVLGNYVTASDNAKTYPFLTQMAIDGTVKWGYHDNSEYQKEAVGILSSQDGFFVLGNMQKTRRQNGFYLAQYKANGSFKNETPIFSPGTYLKAKAFTEMHNGEGFLIAVDRVSKSNNKRREAALFQVNRDGFSPWDNTYNIDQDAFFSNIQRMPKGRYMLSGMIKQEDGRMAGWLFYTDSRGQDGWQQKYIRGETANIIKVVPLKSGGYITIGEIKSFNTDKTTTWVMEINSNAQPVWQRFIKGDFEYIPKDISVEESGLIQILVNAKKHSETKSSEKSHIRIISLSPRGKLLNVESFLDGDDSEAVQFIKNEQGLRTILGSKTFFAPEEIAKETGEMFIKEGWLFTIPPVGAYVDICNIPAEP